MLFSLKSRGVLLLISADKGCIILLGVLHLRDIPCNFSWGRQVDQNQATSSHQVEMLVWQLCTGRQLTLFYNCNKFPKSRIWDSRGFHLNIRKDKVTLCFSSKISPLLAPKEYHCSGGPHDDPPPFSILSFQTGCECQCVHLCYSQGNLISSIHHMYSHYVYRVINKANMVIENTKQKPFCFYNYFTGRVELVFKPCPI